LVGEGGRWGFGLMGRRGWGGGGGGSTGKGIEEYLLDR